MQTPAIDLPLSDLEAIGRRHSVCKLPYFGALMSARFEPASDEDFRVKFVPGRTPGLIGLAQMELELSE